MSYEMKEGQGSLFKNDKKTEDNQPDYTGKVMIGGEEKRMAAWVKKPEGKKAFLSISISDFQKREEAPFNSQTDDSIPF